MHTKKLGSFPRCCDAGCVRLGPRRGACVAVAFRLPPLLMQTDAFPDGGVVPEKYVFRGAGVQPGFKFSNAPATTVTYAIIFHDIDVALQGGTDDVLHWVAWNIPASANGIPEGKLPEGSVTGKNITGTEHLHGSRRPCRSAPAPLRVRAVCAEREARSSGYRQPQ